MYHFTRRTSPSRTTPHCPIFHHPSPPHIAIIAHYCHYCDYRRPWLDQRNLTPELKEAAASAAITRLNIERLLQDCTNKRSTVSSAEHYFDSIFHVPSVFSFDRIKNINDSEWMQLFLRQHFKLRFCCQHEC